MSEEKSLEYLKKRVKNFSEERDWTQFHNNKDLAIGIATESSELLDIFRFKTQEQIRELFSNKKEKIEDEVADILFFLLTFSQINDINLSEALENKISKNEEKYPVEKSKGSNKKFNE